MMFNFSGQTAVITGAASGIGAAAARQLSALGANVLVTDINDTAGQAVATELNASRPGTALYAHLDVTDAARFAEICQLAFDHFGNLTVLINNAGRGSLGETPDIPLEEWRSVIEIDLFGVFYGCRAAIPLLRKSGGGAIINIASLSGIHADHGFAAYNAAKAGVINYTRTLALDHAKDNIRSNAVCPGWIDTPLTEMTKAVPQIADTWAGNIPLKRSGTVDEVANVITFLASPLASYMTGAIVVVDGGLGCSNGQPNIPEIISQL
jgi:meso-butanediol dehydrogenase / (S,S)-butanediol dehydrogenase / diacetyl reductase